jgi:hypothetical protein
MGTPVNGTTQHGGKPGQIDISAAGQDEPRPALQLGGRRTERAAVPGRRLPPLPASGDRLS